MNTFGKRAGRKNLKNSAHHDVGPADRLGDLFFVGFDGTVFGAEIRELLDEVRPAGVILFARNIEEPIQAAELNSALQSYARETFGKPLLIGVDQEGGRVARLKFPFVEVPPAHELACSQDPRTAVVRFAYRTAWELRALGFSVNFAPVLDVPASPDYPAGTIIGDRAFSSNPETTSDLGSLVIHAFRAAGIIPCGKHFPGHGGTFKDSHLELPVDTREPDELRARDLVPFRRAITRRLEMIMTAHVLYPKLDSTYPATLSHTVISDLLRDEIGYSGVVITDDLNMKGVSGSRSVEECSVRALKAGCDLLLICNSPDAVIRSRNAVSDALREGLLSTSSISAALGRITSLIRAYEPSFGVPDVRRAREYFQVDKTETSATV